MTDLPKISIVTPSFNQAPYIQQTIKSVLSQNYPNLEYLIIDGGSTDGTLDILAQYDQRLTWISEPDQGQTDALNKGFMQATGDILAWLNSDDIYLTDTLQKVANFFEVHPETDLVYGDYHIIDQSGTLLLQKREIPFDYNILLYGFNYIGQPATFFRRAMLDRIGFLDKSLHYGMDWEYWLRAASNDCKIKLLPDFLAAFRWHTTSKTIGAPAKMYAEFKSIQYRYWNKHQFSSRRWQKMYETWLNTSYRLKRQFLKLVIRHTFDFPFNNLRLTSIRKKFDLNPQK